jgi:hypothetical protein
MISKPCSKKKWFPSLWYIRSKLCTYLVPRLTLSPNGLKQASTWHTLPRSTIKCAQSDFHACGIFVVNRAPIFHRYLNYLQTVRNELPLVPRRLGVQLGASKMISKPMLRLAQTVHLPGTETNTISKWIETCFHLTYITYKYHRTFPERLHAHGTFITNHAPILHQD